MNNNPNTQLPVEVVNAVHMEAEEIYNKLDELARDQDSCAFGLPMFNKVKEPIENALTAYASKLHQANETIKVLEYDNNRLKGEVEGLTSALDELRTKYDNILATESGHESKTENVWQSGYAAGHEAGCERGKRKSQPGARWPLFVIDKATGERHQVNKVVYHPENEPEPHVWCDTWYGHHVIGNDCEWADEQSNGARWVKCSDRLPEISKPPKLLTVKRYEAIPEIYSTRAVTAAQLADIVKYDLANFEWLDEQPAAGMEEDAVGLLRWLNENDWSGVGSGEYINSTTGRILKEDRLYDEFKRREK